MQSSAIVVRRGLPSAAVREHAIGTYARAQGSVWADGAPSGRMAADGRRVTDEVLHRVVEALQRPAPKTAGRAAADRRAGRARPSADAIRERAYQLYLERNGGPGDPVADWLEAERELRETHWGA